MKILNFAFGSHLDLERYCEMIGGQPMSRIPAVLKDYRLTASALVRFPKEHIELAGEGGGPRLIPQKGSQVYGVLYEITKEQWELVDHYEREWAYESFPVTVETNDRKIKHALAHNLIEHGDFLAPSEKFIYYMSSGLRELGYSEEIVGQVWQSVTTPQ